MGFVGPAGSLAAQVDILRIQPSAPPAPIGHAVASAGDLDGDGAVDLFIIGENRNFMGAEDLLRERGVEMIHLDHPGCIALMAKFQRERPE